MDSSTIPGQDLDIHEQGEDTGIQTTCEAWWCNWSNVGCTWKFHS